MTAEEKAKLNLCEIGQKSPDEAREWFEGVRWPHGPVCPHCRSQLVKKIESRPDSRRPGRKGLYRCRKCNDQFTVTVGTIFEDSHIPLNKWMIAIHLLCGAKKGMSAHQLHRQIGVTYKTAWFMAHRIRFAMTENGPLEKLGGKGKAVEVDETFVGGKPRPQNRDTSRKQRGRPMSEGWKKTPVVALVQRNGDVRTRVVANVSAANLKDFVDSNIAKPSTVNTDQFHMYKNLFYFYGGHKWVNHSAKEYARVEKDGSVSHTNTAESFFSLIKRSIYGSFHHVSKEHLHRYCNEVGFRWNTRKITDGERTHKAFEMTEGKRLTYKDAV